MNSLGVSFIITLLVIICILLIKNDTLNKQNNLLLDSVDKNARAVDEMSEMYEQCFKDLHNVDLIRGNGVII